MKENVPLLASIWQKCKSLFSSKTDVNGLLAIPSPNSNDPIHLLDELQSLVHKLRRDLDLETHLQWDLDTLAASTYLFHVDRILMKVRENMLNYRFRLDESKANNDFKNQTEFTYAKETHAHCYIAILNLTTVLKKASLKQIYSDHVVNPIHALELASANLNSAMRSLNQLSLRQETLLQLSALEQNLMQTLSNPPPDYVYTHHGILYSTTEYLRNQLKEITIPEDIKWLNTFIDAQDSLKKCYVVARKGVIKELLDKMSDNIQELIRAINQKNPDEEAIIMNVTAVFNGLESIRFNCHRENGCSKNLFDKVKIARLQLRKACISHPIGREYLNRMAIKREPLKVKSRRS
jgi:hypothetical protein